MKSYFALATLLGAATAAFESYAHHEEHKDYIDTSASTKETGLVLWQYFFQQYVEGKHADAVDPGNFDELIHLCWFQLFVELWDSNVDDRFAITLAQNCPSSLIASFTFSLGFAS